jgi:hypothetical protein
MGIRNWIKRKTVFPKFPAIPGQESILMASGDYINISNVSFNGVRQILELPPEVQMQAAEAVVTVFRRRLFKELGL